MGIRFTVVLLAAALGTLSPALAQDRDDAPGAEPKLEPKGKLVEPPANLPKPQKGDPTRNLDFLFEALKLAPDDSTAKAIEQRIWAQWYVTKSDTATILMTRVKTAVEAKDLDLAVKLLDALVKIRPDYVEAWNRRATIYYLKKDYGHAMADIREVLRREPRHFGAMSGLGLILQEVGDDKHALDIYRRALAVYPRLERIPDLVKTLTEKVEGRDI
ncbi:MAG: tetratricopeptide repeat protein [Pseudolabrys sp.]|nr:tetratricopeptide repeat protein [Pseudolabrys sp.]